jgi:HlyD family secretion protein
MRNWLDDKRLRWIAAAATVALIVFYYFSGSSSSTTRYVTAQITQGPIVRAISATGTVNPVITVQVGTYVSGPIQQIFADFNSSVKQGQLIAKIDPRPYEVKVEAARAALAAARAQLSKDSADLAYKKVSWERDSALFREGAISKDLLDAAHNAYQQASAQVELARATIAQAQANLDDATVNLNYTDIRSPVDGTVVSRNVDVGQTVAASFQTPTLFLIAKDLTRMQVNSNVSESDIGDVRLGQSAKFKVDAFAERDFDGTVTQVRQAPITIQNVVTYDVVVSVENPEMMLKPGMTANVTIVTARRANATRIPIEAMRYSPPGKRLNLASAPESASPAASARVWIRSGSAIEPIAFSAGLSDAMWVEMLKGPLKAGDEVVTDETHGIARSTQSSSFPGGGMRMMR